MLQRFFSVEKINVDNFKQSRIDAGDAERSCPSKSAVVSENIKKDHQTILEDRKVKLRKMADTLKLSENCLFAVFHEHSVMPCGYSGFVRTVLTFDSNEVMIQSTIGAVKTQ